MVETNSAASTAGVVKSFSGGVRALDGVDFSAAFGRIVGLLGANGSGKTTLLRLLFGSLAPDAGNVCTLGSDPRKQRAKICAEVAYVSQQQGLDPEMTGHETLVLFSTLYRLSGRSRRKRIEFLTADLGLTDVAGRRASTYSGGLRQRLHLALALIHQPRLLLLDEPTSGLDPEGRATVWQVLHAAAEQGAAVIIITHELEEAQRHCDGLALLSQGRLRAVGSPAEIVAQHGRVTLDVVLARKPQDEESLREQLAHVEGVEQVELKQRRIALQMHESPGVEDRVVDWIKSQQIEMISYRCERPNLASAYFHLTGQHLTADGRRPQKGRRRERP